MVAKYKNITGSQRELLTGSLLLAACFVTGPVYAFVCPPSGTVVAMAGPNNNGTPVNYVNIESTEWALTIQSGSGPAKGGDGGSVALGQFINAQWYPDSTTQLLCYYTYPSGSMLLETQTLQAVPQMRNGVPTAPWVATGGAFYNCTESSSTCSLEYISG